MNKNAIKKFAIAARRRLIDSVTDRAGMIGITAEGISEPVTKGAGFEVYKTSAGTEITLTLEQCDQRRQLKKQIESRGFGAVVEEVAYTWFNRICAIRFMEVNDYLPNRVRVLSSEKDGKMEPDIVTRALEAELDLAEKDRQAIIDLKMSGQPEDADKLYRMLFLKECHLLNEILPELFKADEDSDYMEILFGISYANKDDVIYMLVNQDTGIPEEDFNVSAEDEEGNLIGQVEIIGWLYQYYNTELKDDTFAKLKKNIKITKERIPAATQLFTPDWIVRYMVENSVGKIWIEHLRAIHPDTDEKAIAESFGWKYYLPEAEQEEAVNVKLAEIRTTYKDLKPTDITCIDPCMGSGHILIAMFDVLMDIYESAGYDKREAAFEIVENNIHGLDIDQRAYQLSYFAVMMKGRGYNRRFLRDRDRKPEPKVYAIEESNDIDRSHLQFFGNHLSEKERSLVVTQMESALDTFIDAKEYGSILNVEACDWNLLERFVEDYESERQIGFDDMGSDKTQDSLRRLIKVAKNLGQKYDAVVTNPPYMGASGMGTDLSKYVKKYYPDSKSDLFAVFIEKCGQMTKKNAYQAMITQHAWMFLSSFEKLRNKLQLSDIVNMTHLGPRAFEEIGGEVVQTTSFVIRKSHIEKFKGTYCRLVEPTTQQGKDEMFLDGENRYFAEQDNFSKIPGSPVAYWIEDKFLKCFDEKKVSYYGDALEGIKTGDNDRFLRIWYEVDNTYISLLDENMDNSIKWVFTTKGGIFRKWYGNIEYVMYWKNNGQEICNYPGSSFYQKRNIFRPATTWTYLTSGKMSFRYLGKGYFYNNKGPAVFCDTQEDAMLLTGFLNSNVANYIQRFINPTLTVLPGNIRNIPCILPENDDIFQRLIGENIKLSEQDWNSSETSWNFKYHPLLNKADSIAEAFEKWSDECDTQWKKLKYNEEELNRIFIDIYGLQDELSPEVEEKDITVRKADLQRDIRSFVSYAVGCMFGRYSLDEEGLIYAGGEWDSSRYKTFMPDEDNCIPITDEEYFFDDIVGYLVEFVKTVYGADTLEENLDFIAKALGNKGDTSREVIRNYFLKDFYADHLKVYQKRPIYWLFDSGKENGFKALIYMHRYDADTVGRVRTDYLHRAQKYVETAMQSAQYTIDNASSASEKSKARKAVTKYTKQFAEMKIYDEAISHIANKRIEIDLDDGVKVNYAKFQGVEVAQEGKKALKVDLLTKIK